MSKLAYLCHGRRGTAYTNLCPDPRAMSIAGIFWKTLTLNVMDYGAHADHDAFVAWKVANPTANQTTNPYDDTPHIQAAVNAAAAQGGGTVYLPAGTYSLASPHNFTYPNANGCCVELKDGVHMVGESNDTTFINMDYVGQTAIAANKKNNIGVAHLDMYLTGTHTANSGNMFKIIECTNAVITRVILHDTYIGNNTLGCHNTLMEDCVAYNMDNVGFAWSERNDVLTSSGNNVCRRCEAYDCVVAGFRSGGVVGTAYPGMDSKQDDTTFTDCYSHDNTGPNFFLSYAKNTHLDGCTAEDSATYNVTVAGCDDVHIHDMTYVGTGGSAASIATAVVQSGLYTYYGASTNVVED